MEELTETGTWKEIGGRGEKDNKEEEIKEEEGGRGRRKRRREGIDSERGRRGEEKEK